MKVLKTANELRLEHMQMYFGKREEFKIELPLDSIIVHDVIEEINKDTKIRCIKHYTDEFGNRRHIPETEVMLDPYDIMKAMDNFEEKKVRERYGIKR